MVFYIKFEEIPRTISGKNRINEDQNFCAQSQKVQEQIKNCLTVLGVDIQPNEECICVDFEGYNSLSWNRDLPAFVKENYGISFWPLIWPEHLIEKSEFDLSFKNRKTDETDIFCFQKVIRVAPPIKEGKEGAVVVIKEEEEEEEEVSAPIPQADTDWRIARNRFPGHKWVRSGNYDY